MNLRTFLVLLCSIFSSENWCLIVFSNNVSVFSISLLWYPFSDNPPFVKRVITLQPCFPRMISNDHLPVSFVRLLKFNTYAVRSLMVFILRPLDVAWWFWGFLIIGFFNSPRFTEKFFNIKPYKSLTHWP